MNKISKKGLMLTLSIAVLTGFIQSPSFAATKTQDSDTQTPKLKHHHKGHGLNNPADPSGQPHQWQGNNNGQTHQWHGNKNPQDSNGQTHQWPGNNQQDSNGQKPQLPVNNNPQQPVANNSQVAPVNPATNN